MKEQIIKIIENSSPELAAEEILDLFNVSQQRELLFDFVAYIEKQSEYVNEVNNNDIDSFLSNNCG